LSADFKNKLTQYLDVVSKATSEPSKTFLFLNFVSEIFKDVKANYAEELLPELERYIRVKNGTVVVAGRVDVFLGNLIIEFESDLGSKLEEAEGQLRKYISILWSGKKHRVEWLAVASDGVNFHVYRPRTHILLEKDVAEMMSF